MRVNKIRAVDEDLAFALESARRGDPTDLDMVTKFKRLILKCRKQQFLQSDWGTIPKIFYQDVEKLRKWEQKNYPPATEDEIFRFNWFYENIKLIGHTHSPTSEYYLN